MCGGWGGGSTLLTSVFLAAGLLFKLLSAKMSSSGGLSFFSARTDKGNGRDGNSVDSTNTTTRFQAATPQSPLANRNIIIDTNILCEKPREWLPCFP